MWDFQKQHELFASKNQRMRGGGEEKKKKVKPIFEALLPKWNLGLKFHFSPALDVYRLLWFSYHLGYGSLIFQI